jgi:hypothetical protein
MFGHKPLSQDDYEAYKKKIEERSASYEKKHGNAMLDVAIEMTPEQISEDAKVQDPKSPPKRINR